MDNSRALKHEGRADSLPRIGKSGVFSKSALTPDGTSARAQEHVSVGLVRTAVMVVLGPSPFCLSFSAV